MYLQMTDLDRQTDEYGCDPTPIIEVDSERRGSCRYPVAELPILLSWWEAVEDAPEAVAPARGAVRWSRGPPRGRRRRGRPAPTRR